MPKKLNASSENEWLTLAPGETGSIIQRAAREGYVYVDRDASDDAQPGKPGGHRRSGVSVRLMVNGRGASVGGMTPIELFDERTCRELWPVKVGDTIGGEFRNDGVAAVNVRVRVGRGGTAGV